MRPGQPPDRIVRGSLVLPSRRLGAARRRYWSDSAHQECRIYQYWLQKRDSENHFFCNPCGSQRSSLLKERAGEEAANARATGTH